MKMGLGSRRQTTLRGLLTQTEPVIVLVLACSSLLPLFVFVVVQVMDARDMAEFEAESFDAVIDKGMTDSIMYNDKFALMMAKVICPTPLPNSLQHSGAYLPSFRLAAVTRLANTSGSKSPLETAIDRHPIPPQPNHRTATTAIIPRRISVDAAAVPRQSEDARVRIADSCVSAIEPKNIISFIASSSGIVRGGPRAQAGRGLPADGLPRPGEGAGGVRARRVGRWHALVSLFSDVPPDHSSRYFLFGV